MIFSFIIFILLPLALLILFLWLAKKVAFPKTKSTGFDRIMEWVGVVILLALALALLFWLFVATSFCFTG